ncbi:hypothetical protein KJ590_02640 [Patescibacteria group bacterium]|nr:hypothetical protein [Patescibacteria group bacterium]
MPYKDQKGKWFTILIFIALPFYVLFRYLQGKLPPLSQVGPPKPQT